MPNGKPGDHPLTDMLVHGLHPFPADIEKLLREILLIDPDFPDGKRPYTEQVEWYESLFDWQRGKSLDKGRAALKLMLAQLRKAGEGQQERS